MFFVYIFNKHIFLYIKVPEKFDIAKSLLNPTVYYVRIYGMYFRILKNEIFFIVTTNIDSDF